MTQEGASFSLSWDIESHLVRVWAPQEGGSLALGQQIPRSEHLVRPPGSQAALRQRRQQSRWTEAWLHTHSVASLVTSTPSLIILPSFGPHKTKGLAKGAVTPSLPYPHSHTHSPFLNTSRRAERCRPKNTTMLQQMVPRAPNSTFNTAQPQGDSGMQGCKASSLPASCTAQFQQEGEGLLQILLPPLQKIPPIH